MLTLACRARNRVRDTIRFVRLRLGLRALAETIEAGLIPESAFLEQLVCAWGNEAWSSAAPLLSALLEWMPRTSGPILECGSGLSTLILGIASIHTSKGVLT